MKFFMTGLENGDLLIQVTAWAGLTICLFYPDAEFLWFVLTHQI